MTESVSKRPADATLDLLVQVERRLDERVQAAEREARARLEAACSEIEAARLRESAQIEAAAAEQERADLEHHRRRLADFVAGHEAALRRLEDLPDSRIDALARAVVAQAIGASNAERR